MLLLYFYSFYKLNSDCDGCLSNKKRISKQNKTNKQKNKEEKTAKKINEKLSRGVKEEYK